MAPIGAGWACSVHLGRRPGWPASASQCAGDNTHLGLSGMPRQSWSPKGIDKRALWPGNASQAADDGRQALWKPVKHESAGCSPIRAGSSDEGLEKVVTEQPTPRRVRM